MAWNCQQGPRLRCRPVGLAEIQSPEFRYDTRPMATKLNTLPRELERSGELCLAFANTAATRRDDRYRLREPPPAPDLDDYDDLVVWSQRMGAVQAPDAQRLRRLAEAVTVVEPRGGGVDERQAKLAAALELAWDGAALLRHGPSIVAEFRRLDSPSPRNATISCADEHRIMRVSLQLETELSADRSQRRKRLRERSWRSRRLQPCVIFEESDAGAAWRQAGFKDDAGVASVVQESPEELRHDSILGSKGGNVEAGDVLGFEKLGKALFELAEQLGIFIDGESGFGDESDPGGRQYVFLTPVVGDPGRWQAGVAEDGLQPGQRRRAAPELLQSLAERDALIARAIESPILLQRVVETTG